jgi:hypothetical protein
MNMDNILLNTNCVVYVRTCDWNELTDIEPVILVQYESSVNCFKVIAVCFVIAFSVLLICYGIARLIKAMRRKGFKHAKFRANRNNVT